MENNSKNNKLEIRIGSFFIILGLTIRIFMLIFYYYVNSNPLISWDGWGDVEANYYDIDTIFTGEWKWTRGDLPYPPLSIYFLIFLRFFSFGIIEVFVFYAFLLEFIVAMFFYFILKRFNIPRRIFVFGLFLINPFYFLNYVFSASNCGYHITDSFFMLFLMIALYFYPKKNKSLFYFFLALSMCAKWYTLPAALLFLLKFIIEKDWKEVKKILLFIGIPVFIFLISPLFYLPNHIDLYRNWLSIEESSSNQMFLFFLKIFTFLILTIFYVTQRLKKADPLEICFFSIILMNSFMLWASLFFRYLTPLILYGHLKVKNNIINFKFKLKNKFIKIKFGNHVLTYTLSIIGCTLAILKIYFFF